MLSVVLAAYLATALGPQERPTRPTDEAMLEHLLASRPNIRVLSVNFRDTPYGGARTGCGLMELDGQTEPFSLLNSWQDESPARATRAARPEGWSVRDTAPHHIDRDGDGEITCFDRNLDIADRNLALLLCKDTNPIAKPEGVDWVLELEPHPDPVRAARTEGLAERLAAMVMAGAKRRAGE
jgi:hypothetical protein